MSNESTSEANAEAHPEASSAHTGTQTQSVSEVAASEKPAEGSAPPANLSEAAPSEHGDETEEKPEGENAEGETPLTPEEPIDLFLPPPVANTKVPRLIEICLKTIIANFDICHEIHLVPKRYHQYIYENFPIDLLLEKAVTSIPDGRYWKKRTLANYPDVSYEPSMITWKQFYLELYSSKSLENFQTENEIQFFKELSILSPYVKSIKISRSPNKIPLLKLFRTFRNLQKLSIVYGEPRRSFKHYEEFESFTVLSECSATLRDCQQIAEDFKSLGTSCVLKDFDMSDNSLSNDAAVYVAKGLINLRNLVSLRFAYNEIKNTGAHALSTVMEKNPLQVLDLSHNLIGGEGVHHVVMVSKMSKTLKTLNLCGNKIGNKGVISIAILVDGTSSLENLDISGNNISVLTELVEALQKNKTLKYLNVTSNPISDESYEALQNVVKDHSTLEKVDMRRYDVTEADFVVKTTETSEAPLLRFK